MPARTTLVPLALRVETMRVEVGAGVGDGQAAEAVVATEFDDDDGGLQGEDGVEALDAVLGGVAADALLDDAIVIAVGVEVGLKIVGVAWPGSVP